MRTAIFVTVALELFCVGTALLTAQKRVPAEMSRGYGTGLGSCGTWTRNERLLPNHNFQVSWVLGFVSGAGWEGPQLKVTDSDAIDQFVTAYCSQHPTDQILDAAKALIKTLQE
jgi:hypothetical protein